MNSPEFPVVATRLCAACGMCCDGTMFQMVRMQPGDSPAELARLGMRIRRQEEGFVMEQPCAGLCERRCTIYEARPARCRAFLCQQLRLVEGHVITEAEARARIELAGRLAAEVRALISQSGYREDGAPLQEQYDRVTVVPVNVELEPEQVPVREKLEATMRALKTILRRDFLPPPVSR